MLVQRFGGGCCVGYVVEGVVVGYGYVLDMVFFCLYYWVCVEFDYVGGFGIRVDFCCVVVFCDECWCGSQ